MLAFPNAMQPDLVTLGPQWNAARSTHHRVAWLARESSKPGRTPIERWTVQASAAWSREHLQDDPARMQAKLLRAFAEVTGIHAAPAHTAVHRWRHARTLKPLGRRATCGTPRGMGVCGDWCIGHRVEDAFLSGWAGAGRWPWADGSGTAAMSRPYRGRFAPSPTGPLHAGSLVAALASWLDTRAHQGRWLVRIEDVDTPRCVAGADQTILEQLAVCGLVTDEPVVWQSRRGALYQQALDRLVAQGLAYACACSRSDIEAEWARQGVERGRHSELVYPGTCRNGLQGAPQRAWRLRTVYFNKMSRHPSVAWSSSCYSIHEHPFQTDDPFQPDATRQPA
jgi:hypothetical protein